MIKPINDDIEEQKAKQQVPVFEGDDLFKAMRICVLTMGLKNIEERTAKLAIPANSIKDTPEDAEMEISYDEKSKCFMFRVPIKIKRKRKIVTPNKRIITL